MARGRERVGEWGRNAGKRIWGTRKRDRCEGSVGTRNRKVRTSWDMEREREKEEEKDKECVRHKNMRGSV